MSEHNANQILDAIRTAMAAPRSVELGGPEGMTLKEIAKDLGCPEKTAKRYVMDLLRELKMEVVRVRRRSMGGFGSPCEVMGYRLK